MDPETIIDFEPPRAARQRSDLPPLELKPQMARALLGAAAVACAAGSVLALALAPQAGAVGGLFALLSLATLPLTRLPAARLAPALGLLLLALMIGIGFASVHQGWGLGQPGVAVFGLLVCIACVAVSVGAGLAMALAAGLVTAVVAWLSASLPALSPLPPIAGGPSFAHQLGAQALTILSGLAAGVMISRVVARYTRDSRQREDRFGHLLALAADVYWEIDDEYRLVGAAEHSAGMRRFPEPHLQPWDMPRLGCEADTMDLLRAHLEAREPFRDLRLSWALAEGGERDFLASGEPRFNERGIFTGYWGVARDVTEIQATRSALAATETRYQDLFSRIPTPLVLHRGGQVIDANPAAVAMFGGPASQAMTGSDLLASFEAGESRDRERRRIESLHGQPIGTALPVADFRLRLADRLATVRATGVRVDAEGGPAVLSIFVDDTERLGAEEAVRRSEAMLAHLVATSPDLITLTDMATGRYAMVNQAFERVSGWSAAEAVDRTALDLGIWGDDGGRERFVAILRERGAVADLPVSFITKNGGSVPMLVSAARFVMDRRDYIVINARDMTERERERQQREAILANESIGIAVTRDRCFVLANRHFEHICGWGEDELLGQPGAVVWPSERDYEEVGTLSRPLLERGEAVEFERLVRRKDGSSFLASVRGRAIDPLRARERGTVWIVEDVTQRHAGEQALARARDDAEAANRAKSAFLANTSHELRTPLNAMVGLARLARSHDITPDRRRQYLGQIVDSAQALAGIISDILDLSKIEAGKLQIEATEFDLGEQLRVLHQTYTPLALASGLTLHMDLNPAVDGVVRGDPLRLRQIVSNFLNNALKFTAQGRVTLRAQRGTGSEADSLRIEVRDTGPGIDEATRSRLFMPFVQADQSTTRRHGGSGLGLSICRELAQLMGGEVGVDSQVGQGSVFWVELPMPSAKMARAEAAPVTESPASLEGTHVLMVEDNPVNMMIGVAKLERWGVSVEQAADGREAVVAVERAAAAGHPFDAVLMDVQMPVMSGYEATRVLRATDSGRMLPIIALTAAALVSEREQALAAGMNDFLTKPVDAGRLRDTLARWSVSAL